VGDRAERRCDDRLVERFRSPVVGLDLACLPALVLAQEGIENGQLQDRNWPLSWGGRYWDRTSDLLGVNEALSR
jgi:hypothetical protein